MARVSQQTRPSSSVAVVTGASRGIGAHLSRGLAAAGWTVVGLSRSGQGMPAGVRAAACDVTDAESVEQTVGAVLAEHGRIHLLVNNAGLVEPEVPLWDSDVDTWWQVVVTNVRGPYLMTRAVAPAMIEQGGGRVVNLNSGAATRADGLLTAYTASKSALARLTGGTTQAGRAHDLLAFDLAPGVVETDMTHSMRMHEGRTAWTDPEDVVALLLAVADGELDAFAGRMVRAGADSLATLRAKAAEGLPEPARTLRLQPWGPDDPLG